MTQTQLPVVRYELAVCDYDSVWKVNSGDAMSTNTGVGKSKRNLDSLLPSLRACSEQSDMGGAATKDASRY